MQKNFTQYSLLKIIFLIQWKNCKKETKNTAFIFNDEYYSEKMCVNFYAQSCMSPDSEFLIFFSVMAKVFQNNFTGNPPSNTNIKALLDRVSYREMHNYQHSVLCTVDYYDLFLILDVCNWYVLKRQKTNPTTEQHQSLTQLVVLKLSQ